jgi:hypothetical protein
MVGFGLAQRVDQLRGDPVTVTHASSRRAMKIGTAEEPLFKPLEDRISPLNLHVHAGI